MMRDEWGRLPSSLLCISPWPGVRAQRGRKDDLWEGWCWRAGRWHSCRTGVVAEMWHDYYWRPLRGCGVQTVGRSGGVVVFDGVVEKGLAADRRYEVWHLGLQPVMIPWLQSTWGLCARIQGIPSTKGMRGELITRKSISSWWLPEKRTLTGVVTRRISSKGMPVSAQGCNGSARGTVGMTMHLTRVGQMKLASDLESRRTGTWTWVPSQETHAVMAGWEAEGEEWLVTPVRIPSLTDGRCLLTGRSKVDAHLLCSTNVYIPTSLSLRMQNPRSPHLHRFHFRYFSNAGRCLTMGTGCFPGSFSVS